MISSLGWQPLSPVSNLLRRRDRADLSRLLDGSAVFFEFYDEAYPFDGGQEISLLSAVVSAPIVHYDELCTISSEDSNVILECMQIIWPFNETDREAIGRISFQLDATSLNKEDILELLPETSGWSHIDESLAHIRVRLAEASEGESYAEVGMLCRRLLVDLGKTIFDPYKHPPLGTDDASISPDDVKRIVGRFMAVAMVGPSQQTARQCVRSAVDLASQLVHGNNATHTDALLCAQATFNAVGLLSVLSRHEGHEST